MKGASRKPLFIIAVVVAALPALVLTLSRRMVLHDSFLNFAFEYYCLNSVVTSGQFPQWIPYLTHGVSSYYGYAIQGMNELFINALFLFGKANPFQDFLSVYYFAVFIDELVLLVGVWLLSQRYYASRVTSLFVSVTVLCSSIWMTQILFNLHLYYALPLILELCHRFFDSGRWRYLFFALDLFAVQSFDKVAYFLPMVAFLIAAYLGCYAAFDWTVVVRGCRKALARRKAMVGFIFGSCAVMAVAYGLLSKGNGEPLTHFLLQRTAEGRVPLSVFLSYGVEGPFFKWFELLFGFSPARDYTLYIGLVALVCLFWVPLNRHTKSLAALIAVLLLVSAGTLVSVLLYHLWPLMQYYRHLGYIAPAIRLFLCFLVGFGFEACFVNPQGWGGSAPRRKVATFAFLYAAGFALLWLSLNHDALRELFKRMGFHQLPDLGSAAGEGVIRSLQISAWKIFGLAVVLMALLRRPFRSAGVILGVVLIFHSVDLGVYLTREIAQRTGPIDPAHERVLHFQAIPYRAQRDVSTAATDREYVMPEVLTRRSALNWTVDAFFFRDRVDHPLATEYWLYPMNELVSALASSQEQTVLAKRVRFIFPEHPGVRKMAAVGHEKIQFFTKAHCEDDLHRLARALSDESYAGDMLFVSGAPSSPAFVCAPVADLGANERIAVPYRIESYDSNHLRLVADIPGVQPVWLFYSDTWHSQWKARANDRPLHVWRASIAYKAVAVPPGHQVVEWDFHSPTWEWLARLLWLNSLAWVVFVIWQAVRLSKNDYEQSPS